MKYVLTILMLLIFKNCFCQFSANWTTKDKEIGVVKYEVQQAIDTLKTWITLATIPPQKKDTNTYSFDFNVQNAISYLRVQAIMLKNFRYNTNVIQVVSGTLSVIITNAILRNKTLTFKATDETDIKYYSIEQTKDGVNYVETSRAIAGKGSYKITVK